MDINMTLLVQAGNFLFAYGIIRILLVKPVYAVLAQEALERTDLQEIVDSRSIVLAQKEREKNEQWIAHQQQLIQIMPIAKSEVLFIAPQVTPSPQSISISSQEIERLTYEIALVLVKKVEDDHAH